MKYQLDLLSIGSLIYLFLPITIFILLGTNIYIKISFIILFIISVFFLTKNIILTKINIQSILFKKNIIALVFSLIILFIGLYLSGTGGYCYQNFDYIKHNQLFTDLIQNSGPVKYDGTDGTKHLVYYFAYYLPPSLVGKFIPTYIFNLVVFAGTYIGLFLCICGVGKIIKKISVIPVICLIVFSGFDIFGYFIMNGNFPDAGTYYIDGWSNFLTLQSFTSNLFYAPQIFIPAIISTPCLLDSIINKKFNMTIVLILPCLILGNPFILIGLLLFMTYYIYILVKNKISFLNKNLIVFYLLSLFILLVLCIYISSNSEATQILGFIWEFSDLNSCGPTIILFFILEIGILFIFLCAFKKYIPNIKILYLAILTIILTSIIHIGCYNDFQMRATIPSLFCFYLCFVYLIVNINKSKNKKEKIIVYVISALIIVIMATNGFNEIYRAFTKENSNFLYGDSLIHNELSYQYISKDSNSIYQKYMAN